VLPDLPVYYVGVPQHLAAPAARRYFLRELQSLRVALGNPSDADLGQAIGLCNETRRTVRRLYQRAADLPAIDLYAALRAALTAPPAWVQGRLAALLDGLPAGAALGPRLVLVGPHLADPALFQVLDEAGARVAGDLLDLGRRYVAGQVAEEGDPLEALVDHYLALPPTPTKHHPGRRRDHALIERVRASQADGVILARQKFCDPHGFEVAPLQAALEEAGIPHLYVELEQAPQLGQLRTRVQAFVEMVEFTEDHE
jgi:benzoyl-CoA reductase/2-hydroxyglutaryl-CoA dehydratase subunit BcrC/BadD/HgdB